MKLKVSLSPHIRGMDSVSKIMLDVIIALTPTALVGIYYFGLPALEVIIVSVVSAMLAEGAMQKLLGKPSTLLDWSAALTGLLLAMNLPAGVPWWMAAFGAMAAIVIGKQIYGGLGHNPFNPALVGRVILLISWPVEMTTWVAQRGVDSLTAATPLGTWKLEGVAGLSKFHLFDLFWGNAGGSLGEASAIALLLGALYLIKKDIITWDIPGTFIGTVFAFTTLTWLYNPSVYPNPLFEIFSGGLFLGAFFMATDYVTTPITRKGKIIFAIGCGLLTSLIRLYGNYPEGVSFAILLMNSVTPLIDNYIKPTTFGKVEESE
ncbi:MAG: RnfABCDGE type electron transport complex subunit D [bacterium]